MSMNTPAPPAVVAQAFHARHLSSLWIFLPVGIVIAGLILLPAGLFGLEAYRFKRAKAQFLSSLED